MAEIDKDKIRQTEAPEEVKEAVIDMAKWQESITQWQKEQNGSIKRIEDKTDIIQNRISDIYTIVHSLYGNLYEHSGSFQEEKGKAIGKKELKDKFVKYIGYVIAAISTAVACYNVFG